MTVPVESVSSWEVTLSPVEQQIVLSPRITKGGDGEQPAQGFGLSLAVARLLHLQLAESIRLLEEQTAEALAPSERRKSQRPVPKERRKSRRFEGSPASHPAPHRAPDSPTQQKSEK